MVAFFAEFAAATLVALFYGDADAGNCGSCLTSDIDKGMHGFACNNIYLQLDPNTAQNTSRLPEQEIYALSLSVNQLML